VVDPASPLAGWEEENEEEEDEEEEEEEGEGKGEAEEDDAVEVPAGMLIGRVR
jgi:hypothetical protein